jgi:endonuclease/exonuclease/phosphatase (EEP) superfamily protein YafD
VVEVSWDSHPPVRVGQGLLLAIAGVALVPALASTLVQIVPPTDDGTAMLASFSAYGVLGYVLAALCLVAALIRARRRVGLAVVTFLVLLASTGHFVTLGPLFVADDRPVTGADFRLMTLNLYNGAADSRQVAEQAMGADVVILVEATPVAVNALKGYGWQERFPHAVGDGPNEIVSNTVVYSRFPLAPGEPFGQTAFQQWETAVEVPELGSVRLFAVHPCNPYCGGNRWDREHRQVFEAVAADLTGPMVVAGDFNAVHEHGPMQRLRALGLASVADVAGAGWLPTYPADRRYPPLIPIDHVLIDEQLTVTSVSTFRVDGSDHLGLLTTLADAR